MRMRTMTIKVSEEDMERIDQLVGAWEDYDRKQSKRSPVALRREVNRSSAIRDLVYAWAEGLPLPEPEEAS